MLALTTKGAFVDSRQQVRAALDAALAAAKRGQQSGAVDSFTCSGFIQAAFEEAAGDCTILHDRWRRSEWPLRLESLDDLLRVDLDPVERERLDALYGDASLLELVELGAAVDRGGDVWLPKPSQLAETARVLFHAVNGFRGAPPDRLVTDGRWVTPTDLWESRSVRMRGRLVSS